MPHVNARLDIGAAINVEVIWSNIDKFTNIVIHPRDFHFKKENCKIIGTIVSTSGFKDIVFQSSICSSASHFGVLAVSHYNRAWLKHLTASESMERLLQYRFHGGTKHEIPDD